MKVFLICFVLSLSLTLQSNAQVTIGSLTGSVHDPSGASIPRASILVTNNATNISSRATTDTGGIFTVPNLAPGAYTVSASSPGFSTETVTDVVVSIQQTTRIEAVLSIGSVTAQVTVSALPSLVQTTSSDLGQVINSEQAEKLPLNGRLFEQLVTIVPGAIAAGNTDTLEDPAAAGAVGPIQTQVNGLPWAGEYFMIDGVHDSEPGNGYLTITPPLDAIQEFKVETADPQAEYGSFGGAIVNINIKSGTNSFHGEGFNFLRNNALNARDYFARTKAPYHSNQFGGTFGGPILKNKLFFFVDYQQLSLHKGVTYLLSFPTAAMRQGILTGQTQAYNPQTGQPYPNNIVTNINPIAQSVANLYPLPNLPGIVNNFGTNQINTENLPQFDVKIDWQITPSDRVFARESYAQRAFNQPAPGNIFMIGGVYSNSANHAPTLGWDHIFSPRTLNDFRLGYMRFYLTEFAQSYGIDENNRLGIPNGNLPQYPNTSGIAQFNIPGYRSTGDGGFLNSEHVTNEFELSDGVTMVRGSHTFKAGIEAVYSQFSDTNGQVDPRGVFNFNSNVTSNHGAPNTGNAFASFLIGSPSQVIRDLVIDTPRVLNRTIGPYAQDDWRITPKLTLNLGLRWDLFTYPVEAHNQQANFNLQTGMLQFASSGNRGPNMDNNYSNFGPRVGFAYSPNNGRSAIHAAFGISYFNDVYGAQGLLQANYPFFPVVNLVTPIPYSSFYSLSSGLPIPTLTPYSPGAIFSPPPKTNVFEMDRNFKQDQAQVWNLALEQQLTNEVAFTLAYVGTHGVHLYRHLQLNQAAPGPGNLTTRLPFYAIDPNVQYVYAENGNGSSRYNSLQAKIEGRFSNNLYFLGSYTWSKSIDDLSNILDPYVDHLNTGLSSTDVRNNFVFTYNYLLPFGKNQRFLNRGGIVSTVAGGWSLNGITTFQAGMPLIVKVAASSLNNNGPGNTPDLTCQTVRYSKTVKSWFDTGCFANPPLYTFGNAGTSPVRAPGLDNWDFSLAKLTSLKEGVVLKIEGDFFNLWNNAHFAAPNTTFGAPGFGTITSDRLPPRLIQLGAKLSF